MTQKTTCVRIVMGVCEWGFSLLQHNHTDTHKKEKKTRTNGALSQQGMTRHGLLFSDASHHLCNLSYDALELTALLILPREVGTHLPGWPITCLPTPPPNPRPAWNVPLFKRFSRYIVQHLGISVLPFFSWRLHEDNMHTRTADQMTSQLKISLKGQRPRREKSVKFLDCAVQVRLSDRDSLMACI